MKSREESRSRRRNTWEHRSILHVRKEMPPPRNQKQEDDLHMLPTTFSGFWYRFVPDQHECDRLAESTRPICMVKQYLSESAWDDLWEDVPDYSAVLWTTFRSYASSVVSMTRKESRYRSCRNAHGGKEYIIGSLQVRKRRSVWMNWTKLGHALHLEKVMPGWLISSKQAFTDGLRVQEVRFGTTADSFYTNKAS